MRILISGGAGFIGSNLANKLVNYGYSVDIVDNLSAGNLKFLLKDKNGNLACRHFYHCEFDDNVIKHAIHKKNYDVIYHMAALPKVSYSVEQPLKTHDVNVSKTLKLLQFSRDNVGRFVNTSSSAVYGQNYNACNERTETKPNSPYALQKLIIESYCKLYTNLYNLDTVSIRPFNVFGPHQLGNSAYACALSAWLYCLKHNKPLRSDGDGGQSRDLIYVDDLVDLFIKAGEHKNPLLGAVFNGGTGKAFSNTEILNWFQYHYYVDVVNAPQRVGDVKHTLADITASKNQFNWEPKTLFWNGVLKTKRWAMKSELF